MFWSSNFVPKRETKYSSIYAAVSRRNLIQTVKMNSHSPYHLKSHLLTHSGAVSSTLNEKMLSFAKRSTRPSGHMASMLPSAI